MDTEMFCLLNFLIFDKSIEKNIYLFYTFCVIKNNGSSYDKN